MNPATENEGVDVDSDAGTGVDVGVVVDMNDLPAPNAPSKVVEGALDVELETGAAFVKEKPVKEVDGAAGNEDRFIVAPALEAVVDAAFPVVVVVVAEDEEKLNPNLDCEDVAVSNLSLSNLSLLLAPMKSPNFLESLGSHTDCSWPYFLTISVL